MYKAKGKVSDLERSVEAKRRERAYRYRPYALGHAWRTMCRKRPSHYSASGNLALIHNGIIENYATLKERLQQRGVKFRSRTDSEVLVQLIEYIQVSNDLVVGCRASGLA